MSRRAVVSYGTAFTERFLGLASELSEPYKGDVDVLPVLTGKHLSQLHLGLFGIVALDPS